MGISLGDVSGIGPEVTAAALALPRVRQALVPVVFGDGPTLARFPVFGRYARATPQTLGRATGPTVCVVTQLAEKDRVPGKPTREGGRAQYAYVTAAIEAARSGQVDALCTAPVSKEGISRAGIPFMGHTEVLAEAFGVEVMMMMDGPRVRVALATNHVPLSALPRLLTVEGLTAQLKLLSRSLTPVVGRKPRIAVLGLNPHAGEGGLLGREEVEVLTPAIRRARAARVDAHGPVPADGLFARPDAIPYDAVLAMYHDQGLIPAKALDFERTVNVTLGLPVPRTSPDHGTAYDIAGKGQASRVPMVEALLKAAQLARRG
ncbi:4-hydroxythreonine-4-phosphate dehydrogenase [Stigmatella aurantiaca]|uniref:4-hydroxythreonine-4-phosphate dehydrogenase n=1 Tax=Stigmatella aurantiaca TaxID=41 RepID=A0A1H7XS75_STIAU|nr:4-hydroxythreonine-4-phosphate dehydrogenase PdxA [Stigmatella aurantiaca]SEM36494.1 4-hydroxythreonine-4-phosphate dehydrogenase [Stigmatella aurantiaca]